MDLRAECGEAIGVFVLATCVGLAAAVGGATALVAGATIMVLVYSLGHVSGAHFNPAITFAFASTGHFPWRRVPSYIAAQVVGAIVGFLLVGWLFPISAVHSPLGTFQAGLLETLATALLAFVIVAVATDRRVDAGVKGLAIGTTVAICVAAILPWSGGTVNPAIAAARALTGDSSRVLLFVAAPFLGAVLGMGAYEGLRKGRPDATKPLGSTGPFELDGP